jgi:2-oxoglutarate ferredoxin oxidoreductase subunit delta
MNFWRVPLDAQEVSVARGIVHIIEDRCKGCGYCIAYCPKEVLAFSDRFNKKGYHPPYAKKPEECVNCHYCEILCPEFAIFTELDPSCPQAKALESDKQPGQSN